MYFANPEPNFQRIQEGECSFGLKRASFGYLLSLHTSQKTNHLEVGLEIGLRFWNKIFFDEVISEKHRNYYSCSCSFNLNTFWSKLQDSPLSLCCIWRFVLWIFLLMAIKPFYWFFKTNPRQHFQEISLQYRQAPVHNGIHWIGADNQKLKVCNNSIPHKQAKEDS